MIIRLSFLALLFFAQMILAQSNDIISKTEIMTLGVFHFDYPNLDAVKTEEKDQVSVLDEPFQSEIKSIVKALKEFNPTILAVEFLPSQQPVIDSTFSLYKEGKFELGKNEVYQLGYRLGKELGLGKIYCVDDGGRHYENIQALFKDSLRLSKLEQYYFNPPDSNYIQNRQEKKVASIIDAIEKGNNPDLLKDRLAIYLLHPFKYEESEGDFTGVDFESGRWYNRNLRIYRNIQRIPHTKEDKILLIIGTEHLNILNLFFDVSREYDFISPLPYLKRTKEIYKQSAW